MHSLQCDRNLGWDEKISDDRICEWHNIVRQANATPVIEIKRCEGCSDDCYNLIAFADSSQVMYGTVIYIQNVRTNEVDFILAKNHIVSDTLESKSIPSLEIHATALATESLIDIYNELTEDACVQPIQIAELKVFSDSLVCLSWLNSFSYKLDKLQKRSAFVLKRITQIDKLCETHPITFEFVSAIQNPANCITRCMSYKRLVKSNYFDPSGFLNKLTDKSMNEVLAFTIPNPLTKVKNYKASVLNTSISSLDSEFYKTTVTNSSPLVKVIGVYQKVLLFIDKLKQNV